LKRVIDGKLHDTSTAEYGCDVSRRETYDPHLVAFAEAEAPRIADAADKARRDDGGAP